VEAGGTAVLCSLTEVVQATAGVAGMGIVPETSCAMPRADASTS